MNTIVLDVRSLQDTLADASRAMKTGRAKPEARISFATRELLWQVLTAKRWELLRALYRVSVRRRESRVPPESSVGRRRSVPNHRVQPGGPLAHR